MVRRPPIILLALALFAGRARADGGYRPPIPTTPIDPLPPGAWFREGYQDFVLEDEPPAPRWAAIGGTFSSAPQAERAARAIDRTRVALGYPWVVANHDLRIERRCSESIVVVAGLFTSYQDAAGWRAQDPSRGRLSLVAIEHEGSESACGWTWGTHGIEDGAGRHLEITHVEPSGDAPGYDPAALEAPDGDARARLASVAPVCTVPRGSVHAFADPDAPWRLGHGFAPARCGRRVVYVPVERTLRATVLERRDDGTTRLHQITEVMCDSASFDVWTYTLDGRQEIESEPPLFGGGSCGS